MTPETSVRSRSCEYIPNGACIEIRKMVRGLSEGTGSIERYREICLEGGAGCPMKKFYGEHMNLTQLNTASGF